MTRPAASYLSQLLAERERRRRQALRKDVEAAGGAALIPESMSFREWAESLSARGLRVDGHPFTLANRQALHEIYDAVPSTIEEAFGQTLVIQKGSQMGLTLFEVLADIYMAVKFAPCKVLMYLPDRSMAAYKSSERFMPIVRSAPDLHSLITGDATAEGNKLTRTMPSLGSSFLFLWTRGRAGGV